MFGGSNVYISQYPAHEFGFKFTLSIKKGSNTAMYTDEVIKTMQGQVSEEEATLLFLICPWQLYFDSTRKFMTITLFLNHKSI